LECIDCSEAQKETSNPEISINKNDSMTGKVRGKERMLVVPNELGSRNERQLGRKRYGRMDGQGVEASWVLQLSREERIPFEEQGS